MDWIGLGWVEILEKNDGLDWIGLDCIGLDWVEILEKNDGLDWIGTGSKVLCIKIFTAIFVRPIIYRYSILYRICKHEYFYCPISNIICIRYMIGHMGWIGLGQNFNKIWIGLGPKLIGLDLVGLRKLDPCPTLVYIVADRLANVL